MKIAFYHSANGEHWTAKALHTTVAWWTNGPYSHCEMVIEELENGYTTCVSSSVIDGGIRFKDIQLSPDKWDIIEFPSTPELEQQVLQWFKNNDDKKYDFKALFHFLVNKVEGDRNEYFCSEAVMESLGYIQSWRYSPNSMVSVLLAIPGAKCVQLATNDDMRLY